MIPLAVELNEIPVVVASGYRISLDHHVRDSGKIEQHLAAGIINVAVSGTSGETSVSSLCVAQASAIRIVNVVVYPVEDRSGSLYVIASPEA